MPKVENIIDYIAPSPAGASPSSPAGDAKGKETPLASSNVFSLHKFYSMLTPKLLNEDYILKSSIGSTKEHPEEKVFNLYTKIISGENIIKELSRNGVEEPKPEYYNAGLLYNTMFQRKDGTTSYLEKEYWHGSSNTTTRQQRLDLPINFYSEVCAELSSDGEAARPPCDLTINIVRGTMANEARKNGLEVERFLNHMPSFFPSMMSPYFNVEFQFPLEVLPFDSQKADNVTKYRMQRPSLLRFLMGSELQVVPNEAGDADGKRKKAGIFPLTTADFNLSSPVRLVGDYVPGRMKDYANFTGMEMFTTPQSLTNMDQLKAGSNRLKDVKPFLPPASVIDAQIQIMNAGAGSFLHRKATVKLKIHDKARLIEFSELFRGPSGYSGTTVWLTYGWLAPRTSDEPGRHADVYSKFINETMLTREAYMVKNSSFAFDNFGQVTVTLELVSKGYKHIEHDMINVSMTSGGHLQQFAAIIERIKKNRGAIGSPPEGSDSADLRIYQILNSAVSGDMDINMSNDDFWFTIQNFRNEINKKVDIAPEDRQKTNELLDDLSTIYTKTTLPGSDKEVTEFSIRAKNDVREFNKKKFDHLKSYGKGSNSDSDNGSISTNTDPFLPDLKKTVRGRQIFADELARAMNDKQGMTKEQVNNSYNNKKNPAEAAKQKKIDNQNLIAEGEKLEAAHPPVTFEAVSSGDPIPRDLVSFGKIFCTFCLPTILKAAEKEEIDEVQVCFYQINESCGPMSLHSIAEFPVAVNDFEMQFAEYVFQRGGESMSVQEFMTFFINNQFCDQRAPGYGMRSYYQPYDANNPEQTKSGSDAAFSGRMAKWTAKWGSFKKPNIAMKIDTVEEGTESAPVNLLHHLQSRIGPDLRVQETKKLTADGQRVKIIKRISIYDKQYTPYEKLEKIIRSSTENSFKVYHGEPIKEVIENSPVQGASADARATIEKVEGLLTDHISNTQSKVRTVRGGQDLLQNYIQETIPTITPGVEGSLVISTNLASKTNGLLGTMHLQGGSFKARSALAPNGLSMGDYSMPVRIIPAQLTMTTFGCPIAEPYQNYFVNFGTGTTLDNLYTVTGLQHIISPGKFQTQWTMAYTDGYGKFFGAPNLNELLKSYVIDAKKNSEDTVPKDSSSNSSTTNASEPTKQV